MIPERLQHLLSFEHTLEEAARYKRDHESRAIIELLETIADLRADAAEKDAQIARLKAYMDKQAAIMAALNDE